MRGRFYRTDPDQIQTHAQRPQRNDIFLPIEKIFAQPGVNHGRWRGLWRTLALRCSAILRHALPKSSGSFVGAYEQPTRQPETPAAPATTQTFTARQKHALELENLPRAEAAREMGFKDPEHNGLISYCQLLARAKLARQWRNAVVEDYLEPRR